MFKHTKANRKDSEKDDFDFKEYMSTDTWERILGAASAAGLDNDKLRSNAVRALGSLLHVSPEANLLMPRHLRLIKQAMLALMKNIETGSLKVRTEKKEEAIELWMDELILLCYVDPMECVPCSEQHAQEPIVSHWPGAVSMDSRLICSVDPVVAVLPQL